MFLAFQYGVMYVLSFATIITAFASALAVADGRPLSGGLCCKTLVETIDEP
jgi:hypothetical protein